MPRPPSSARRPGRPPGGNDDVRQRLLDAAVELSAERSFDELGLREIASAAGVTPAMIAYYFNDKAGLFDALVDTVVERLITQVTDLLASADADTDRTETFIRIYIETIAREPWFPPLVVREILARDTPLRRHFVDRFARRAAELLPAVFRSEVAAGRLDDGLDPVLATLSLVGMSIFPYLAAPVLGPVLGYRLDDAFRDRWIAHTRRLFLRGARPGEGA